MLLEREHSLSDSLRSQINAFMAVCREHGDKGVPYPLDDEDTWHYLLWEEDGDEVGPQSRLMGVSAVLPLSDDSAECICYIHPDERRKGYFSQIMLPMISEDFADLEFLFPVSDTDHDTQAVLESIGAEYDVTEYRMELALDPVSTDDNTFSSLDNTAHAAGPSGRDTEDENITYVYPPDKDQPAATCCLEKISPDSVCLFNVEVHPDKRWQGYGTAMILSLSDELKKYGIRRITVHVSADNLPAVSLYEKTGFRTTETLSYYIF